MNLLEQITHNYQKHVPKPAAKLLAKLTLKYKVNVVVKPARKSKRGDFRPATMKRHHQITINADLPPYEFLITTVHEFAHLMVWEKYKDTVAPHGREWKLQFKQAMQPFLTLNLFPPNIEKALKDYLVNPKASTCNDFALMKALKEHAPSAQSSALTVEFLDTKTAFQLKNDRRWFKKIKKLRKNYLCQEIGTETQYRISPLAEIAKTRSL